MEGATKEDFLKELDEVRDELKELSQDLPDASNSKQGKTKLPHIMPSTPYLSTALLFLFLFFLGVQSIEIPYRIIAFISLLVAVLAGVQHSALTFRKKNSTMFEYIVSIVLLFTFAMIYFFVWPSILVQLPLFLLSFAICLAIGSLFFFLHAYLGYLHAKAVYETKMTGIIMIASWILLLASFLYESSIYFLLFIISFVLFVKASIDFSKRFVRKNQTRTKKVKK